MKSSSRFEPCITDTTGIDTAIEPLLLHNQCRMIIYYGNVKDLYIQNVSQHEKQFPLILRPKKKLICI